MKKLICLVCLFSWSLSASSFAQQQDWLAPFAQFYNEELGNTSRCDEDNESVYRVCSPALKNSGNAPYILHHGKPTEKTVVLFHGLSDSPFFFNSIAPRIHALGYTVIVGLLPGHGKLDADEDMEDSELAERWSQHVDEVVALAHQISPNVIAGGFSTGGALVTLHALTHPDSLNAMLLFSGALALDESVENMAGIWGIKLLSKILDGEYQTQGPNPYKYPDVAKYAAFQLTDVIFAVREQIEQGHKPNLPIFSAHSMADTTTPFIGVENLLEVNQGTSTTFLIDESYDVCHADVVVSAAQLVDMHFDKTKVTKPEKCSIPKANPIHPAMLNAMVDFLNSLN